MLAGERYKREDGIPHPVLVDDLRGTTHQVYGGLADPTYLIDRDGRVERFEILSPFVFDSELIVCYGAQVTIIGLRRKNFMRDVGQQIKQSAVGVINKNKSRLFRVHSSKIELPAVENASD